MIIVRKTAAGGYVELGPSDPLLEQQALTVQVPKFELDDGEIVESAVPVETTAVLRHDWDWARAADAEMLAALGYWKLSQVDAPPGKRQVAYTIEDQEGAPVLVPAYEDIPVPPPVPPPTRWAVPKLVIIERLNAADKFTAAFQGLGGPGALPYERWQAASEIWSDSEEAIALLTAIGADPVAILAPA